LGNLPPENGVLRLVPGLGGRVFPKDPDVVASELIFFHDEITSLN
jgi:hypothetical protein